MSGLIIIALALLVASRTLRKRTVTVPQGQVNCFLVLGYKVHRAAPGDHRLHSDEEIIQLSYPESSISWVTFPLMAGATGPVPRHVGRRRVVRIRFKRQTSDGWIPVEDVGALLRWIRSGKNMGGTMLYFSYPEDYGSDPDLPFQVVT